MFSHLLCGFSLPWRTKSRTKAGVERLVESSFGRDVMVIWVQDITHFLKEPCFFDLEGFSCQFGSTVNKLLQYINYFIQDYLFYLYQICMPWSCLLWLFSRQNIHIVLLPKFNFKSVISRSCFTWFLENSWGCVVWVTFLFAFLYWGKWCIRILSAIKTIIWTSLYLLIPRNS